MRNWDAPCGTELKEQQMLQSNGSVELTCFCTFVLINELY